MDKRNYGIDLLRIISMFMVVVLHVLGQGGILDNAQLSGCNYWVAWLLEIASYCAVNCFALISGYVMCHSKPSVSKITELWFQTFFYCAMITGVFFLTMPQTISYGSILNVLFPVTQKNYWYITAYFGMYLLTPLLNSAIQNTSKKTLSFILLCGFVVFSVIPTIFNREVYNFSKGYSMLWLCVMYITGGYIRHHNIIENVKKSTGWLMFIFSILITWLVKVIFEITTISPIQKISFLGSVLISYTSPTIILAGLGLFIALSKQTFPKPINKVISLLSPAALGVYLIHTHSFIWYNILSGFSADFAQKPVVVMVLMTLLSSVSIYLVCTIIDLLRIQLFRLLRIKSLCIKIEKLAISVLNKIYNKILS